MKTIVGRVSTICGTNLEDPNIIWVYDNFDDIKLDQKEFDYDFSIIEEFEDGTVWCHCNNFNPRRHLK